MPIVSSTVRLSRWGTLTLLTLSTLAVLCSPGVAIAQWQSACVAPLSCDGPPQRVALTDESEPVSYTSQGIPCCSFCIPGGGSENYMGPVHPSISDDGTLVTFSTNACDVTDLVREQAVLSGIRVHQHFVTQFPPGAAEPDAVFVASALPSGEIASDGAGLASFVSGDGGAVVFEHDSYFLRTGGTPFGPRGVQSSNVYLRTLTGVGSPNVAATDLVRVSNTAQLRTSAGGRVSDLRPNGHYRVAYRSDATDLAVPGPSPCLPNPCTQTPHLYVYDTDPNAATLWLSDGPGGSASKLDLSADGDWVVWAELADPVTGNDRVLVREVPSGGSTSPTVIKTAGQIRQPPAISDDGSVVVYDSSGCNDASFASDPNCPSQQVYRWTAATGSELISAFGGVAANVTGASSARVSGDGRFVAYISRATNLDAAGLATEPPPSAQELDAFLYDATLGTTTLLTANTSGLVGVLDISQSTVDRKLWVVFSTTTPDSEFEAGNVDNCPVPACPDSADCAGCNLSNQCSSFAANPCMDVYRLEIDY